MDYVLSRRITHMYTPAHSHTQIHKVRLVMSQMGLLKDIKSYSNLKEFCKVAYLGASLLDPKSLMSVK